MQVLLWCCCRQLIFGFLFGLAFTLVFTPPVLDQLLLVGTVPLGALFCIMRRTCLRTVRLHQDCQRMAAFLSSGPARGFSAGAATPELSRVRNVGIIAHIDAGKTTTTERMLLLSGVTRSAGNVDDGDTVMDHLDQERERGITIQAAATAFGWREHAINLIDTPGHIDFTVEVERSTRVLDGAALIVDAVAGAQAQTETVWRQACAHAVPAVAFVNKMDREGADFAAALQSLETRLKLTPLALQLPLDPTPERAAIVDLVSMDLLAYRLDSTASRGTPLALERLPMPGDPGDADFDAATAARGLLVERVAELEPDGEVAELYLEEAPVPAVLLSTAVRRLTLGNAAVPALCGASLRGIGVEPLLDARDERVPVGGDDRRALIEDR